jgi:hypothetical protein
MNSSTNAMNKTATGTTMPIPIFVPNARPLFALFKAALVSPAAVVVAAAPLDSGFVEDGATGPSKLAYERSKGDIILLQSGQYFMA